MGSELGDPSVAMETLIFVSVDHEGGDDGPFFGVFVVELYEVLIFFRGPGFNFAFFGVEVFLFDFEIDLESVKALDGFAELSWVLFFHI